MRTLITAVIKETVGTGKSFLITHKTKFVRNFELHIGEYDSTIPRDGIMTKPLRGGAISNLFIGETNWSYCLI